MTERDVTDEVRGILADPTPAPEGEAVAWRTVPLEPTEAMLVNGREALMPIYRLLTYGPLIGVWKDMLAASPVVPVGVSEEQRQRVAEIVEAAIERHAPTKSICHTLDDADAILAALGTTVVPVGVDKDQEATVVNALIAFANAVEGQSRSRRMALACQHTKALVAALGTKATDIGREE